MPITDYNYSAIEPTGLANPQNMFVAIAVIFVIGGVAFAVWSLYQWLS